MKVLVVEDTLISATFICHLLEKMGLVAVHASDGFSGIEKFQFERPDLVLLDITMPGMDGFQVARQIRELESEDEWTPIIFLSARSSDDDVAEGITAGGDDYLTKPVSKIVLKAKLRAMQRIAEMRNSLLTLTRKLDEANRELTRLSSVDGLTCIPNRRSFDEALVREWRRAQRKNHPVSVLMADVDHFKNFNDTYGHQAGDDCLKAVAQALSGCVDRATDMVARYGGEEFVALLPETDERGACAVANLMRSAVSSLAIAHPSSSVADHVTLSLGVACRVPQMEAESSASVLLREADKALYEAKRSGRNRVVLSHMT